MTRESDYPLPPPSDLPHVSPSGEIKKSDFVLLFEGRIDSKEYVRRLRARVRENRRAGGQKEGHSDA